MQQQGKRKQRFVVLQPTLVSATAALRSRVFVNINGTEKKKSQLKNSFQKPLKQKAEKCLQKVRNWLVPRKLLWIKVSTAM